MNTAEIFLFVFIVILILVGIGIGIYFVIKHDEKKKTKPDNPNNPSTSGLKPLIPLPIPLNPPSTTPLTPLKPPTLSPLPGPPARPIQNSIIQKIYDAISPTDNGAAAYNILIQNQSSLTNLTPFEYGIAVGLGFYQGVYLDKNSPNVTMAAIQAQLESQYSGNNLAEAWCGVRYTFFKAGYLSQISQDWQNIAICK